MAVDQLAAHHARRDSFQRMRGTPRTAPWVYLSGPMTGYYLLNFPAFNTAAKLLREHGYTVLNPADYGADPAHTWADYLRRDLYDVLAADTVAVLPDWQASRGAVLEVHVAQQLGVPVVPVDVLLDQTYHRMDAEERQAQP